MGERPEPILYAQHGCPDGACVRDWLAGHGIGFVERNVTGDSEAAKALLATGTFGTPLLVVGCAKVIGFRPTALAAVLAGE